MIDQMNRSAIKLLKKRGMKQQEIAKVVGKHRHTVARVLKEPVDKEYVSSSRSSMVDIYHDRIEKWLQRGVTGKRMLTLVREDPENPYQGKRTAFYDRVAKIRKELKLKKQQIFVRFEGLPGEYLQVDWGEVRNFPFEIIARETRYFFAARLKYSRFLYVEFTKNMKLEMLLRCILRCFETIGGVPWVLVFDNMKTVTLGRDSNWKIIWNEKFKKFSAEIDFHPELCSRGAGNQKGTVENLVKLVKNDFLPERTFIDDGDLARQCSEWVVGTNASTCQAHGEIPAELLREEQDKFDPLKVTADTYGMVHLAQVSPVGSTILWDTNWYSVPTQYAGQNIVARIFPKRIAIYKDTEEIAEHTRSFEKGKRVIEPSHYEDVFQRKPRARVMVYRDKLVNFSEVIRLYISHLCRRKRDNMGEEIIKIYQLWQKHGTEELLAATYLGLENQVYGSCYLEYILSIPDSYRKEAALEIPGVPVQSEVDRNLEIYNQYVR